MAEIQHPAAREEQLHLTQTKSTITVLQGLGQEELTSATAKLTSPKS